MIDLNPEEASRLICSVLGPNDLKAPYNRPPAGAHPLWGQCAVASEALFYATGGKGPASQHGPEAGGPHGWTVWRVPHEGSIHWFLKDRDGRIWDPTAAQFATPVPYDRATKTFFVTSQKGQGPSKRVRDVIARAISLENSTMRTDNMPRVRHAPARFDNPVHDEHDAESLVDAIDSDGEIYPLKRDVIARVRQMIADRSPEVSLTRVSAMLRPYVEAGTKILARENQLSGEDRRTWLNQFDGWTRQRAAELVAEAILSELAVEKREAAANAEIYRTRSEREGGAPRLKNPLYPAIGPASEQRANNPADTRLANPSSEPTIPLKLLQPVIGGVPRNANPLASGCSQATISENIRRELHKHPDMPTAQGAAIAYSHARSQGCALPRRDANPHGDNLLESNEILRQMGGDKRLGMWLGAHSYIGGRDSNGRPFLQFKWMAKSPRARGSNTVRIVLDPSDTYTMSFYKVRGLDHALIASRSDVYADDLARTFENVTGLTLHL